jgi:coenzyme F420-reducing hydrogenase gamma subunit
MKYLGIELAKPKIAVFDFTSCEGCQLQLVNKEETLADFLGAVEVVNFREASSAKSDDYDVALIEGAVSRNDEVKRLNIIREKAKVVVALGTCACLVASTN